MKRLLLLFIMSSLFAWGAKAQEAIPEADKAEIQVYLTRAERFKAESNEMLEAENYNKVAQIYWEFSHFQEAADYFARSLALNQGLGNANALWQLTANLGMLNSDMGQYQKSLQFFEQSLEHAKRIGRKDKLVTAHFNVAVAQENLENYASAIAAVEKAQALATELQDIVLLRNCYSMLSDYYNKMGNAAKAIEYTNQFLTMDAYIKQEENAQRLKELLEARNSALVEEQRRIASQMELQSAQDSLARIEALRRAQQLELENQRKQTELVEQQAQLESERQEAEIEKGRVRNMALAAILALVSVFLVIFLKLFRDKKKAAELLAQQNHVLEEHKREIESQNFILTRQKAEIQQMNEEVQLANKELSRKNAQITDSINYAQKIQEAILPSKAAIRLSFPNSFIFYQPRDIVSGDFYWFSRQGQRVFIAAVDCTGHSVPGAFMSMIGNTLLNEIVNEKKVHDPAQILLQLHEGVAGTLNRGASMMAGDGMDISLCCLDLQHKTLEVSCAVQSVLVFERGKARIIEGDLFSVGNDQFQQKVSFTKHSIHFGPETALYLYSDGYQDQFGGQTRKKFSSARFEKLLADCQTLDMPDQELRIEKEFLEWKGESRQIDDILVIGIRLNELA